MPPVALWLLLPGSPTWLTRPGPLPQKEVAGLCQQAPGGWSGQAPGRPEGSGGLWRAGAQSAVGVRGSQVAGGAPVSQLHLFRDTAQKTGSLAICGDPQWLGLWEQLTVPRWRAERGCRVFVCRHCEVDLQQQPHRHHRHRVCPHPRQPSGKSPLLTCAGVGQTWAPGCRPAALRGEEGATETTGPCGPCPHSPQGSG